MPFPGLFGVTLCRPVTTACPCVNMAAHKNRHTLRAPVPSDAPVSECGSVIGVDDFAFKKRHTYGTIIVDQATHRSVAILDGRDGMSLKEWLKNNQHIKTVTRDRANAYSSAIQEILPDAMQIADRFHLHQNLLEAIRNTVNSVIPVDVRIPINYGKKEMTAELEETCKKNALQCG